MITAAVGVAFWVFVYYAGTRLERWTTHTHEQAYEQRERSRRRRELETFEQVLGKNWFN